MASTFSKPKGLKYTDMCIYIDENAQYIIDSGKYPKVESTIFEYLYHIVYALSFKQGFFNKNVNAYDDFALYCAAEYFVTLRKRLIGARDNKDFRGKKVVPIKSILNYIKSTLYPFKVNYQQTFYREVLHPEVGANTDKLKEHMQESIQSYYKEDLDWLYEEVLKTLPTVISTVFEHTPFKKQSTIRTRLEASVMLTLLDQMTLPQHIKNKIEKKRATGSELNREISDRFMKAHERLDRPVRLWHLPESYNNYVKILSSHVRKGLAEQIWEFSHEHDFSDDLIDKIMDTAYSTYDDPTGED